MSLRPVHIQGTVTLSDGSVTGFALDPESGFSQWGNSHDALGDTADLMGALAGAFYEHAEPIGEEEEEEEEEEEACQ